MDKKRSILNVSVAIFFRVVILLLSILTRRYLIRYCGNDANGIVSLCTSLIGFLSIAELGIGTAITFGMYGPITRGENETVSALYHLFVKIYTTLAIIIFVGGMVIMPFLPYLAKGYTADYTLYLSFFIMLIAEVLNYFFSAKVSLINAYKNNYITTAISSIAIIVRDILRILALVFFGSLEAYLLCGIIEVILQWILIEIVARKKYSPIMSIKAKVSPELKHDIVKNTKAMFMHKMGSLLVNASDSVIISAFIGVVLLGKYSNYITIMSAMTSLLALFFSPLTSIIGQLCAEGNINEDKKYFKFMYLLNFVLGIVFFLGYYGIIDNVITLCFGDNLLLDKSVTMVITINYFIQFMRRAVNLFRDASGAFYYDRFKPLIEGVLNIILSIAFVYWIGLVGVIVATIITNLFITHVVEPLVLYKHVFNQKPTKYYVANYGLIVVFVACLFVLDAVKVSLDNIWLQLLANGFIAVGIALVPIIIIYIFNKEFRCYIKSLCIKIMGLFKKKTIKN